MNSIRHVDAVRVARVARQRPATRLRPFGDLALIGGGTLLLMVLVVGAGLLVLRMSTDLEELRTG